MVLTLKLDRIMNVKYLAQGLMYKMNSLILVIISITKHHACKFPYVVQRICYLEITELLQGV
jgi:hypothetical protein